MDVLLVQRRTYKGQITRLQTVIAEHQGQPFTDAESTLYIQKVEKLSDKVEEMQTSIASLSTDEDFVNHEQVYNDMISKLETLNLGLLQTQKTEDPRPITITSSTSAIKLPKLELPIFNGQYEDWLPFHDLFAATVHNNMSLSGAQKMQYLKSSLRNEASLLIHSIPITDGNYIEAWNILTNRFNNPREIIDAHIKRLFNQPTILQESSSSLRRLIDTTTECIRALKVLKEPVEHWDAMLLHILKEKMDHESRRQWELSLTSSQRPSFQEITAFLEQRARALAAAQPSQAKVQSPSRLGTPFKDRRTAAIVHHGATRSTCTMCDGSHSIFNCPNFLKASVFQRQGLVKKYGLCYNCLRSDHQSQHCKAGHCRKCAFKHNTLLHNEDQQQQQMFKQQPKAKETEVVTHMSRDTHEMILILLSTALVHVMDSSGQPQLCRALLDSASQESFII